MSLTAPSGSRQRLSLRQLFPWWSLIGRDQVRADLIAGLLGAVLVLPQGVAFATLAGLPPQYGIYTAVLPCIIAALAGSSWHVMSGPTNATSLAMFAMLSPLALPGGQQYIELALATTLLVGALQFAVGALRLGVIGNFISPAVLNGFISGTALLIAIYALRDLLGLSLRQGTSALGLVAHVFTAPQDIRWPPLVVGAATLAASMLARRLLPRWPHMLIGLVAGYLAAWALNHGVLAPVDRVALIGPIPSALPVFDPPRVQWSVLSELVGLAASLTIIALAQSLSVAKAVANRSGQLIDTNREFVGQGLSNLVGGFFSCYVSCGSNNRSMLNYEAGARTPLASIFASMLLIGMVALSAPLLAEIPLAAIAAILLLVAQGLFDHRGLRRLFHLSRLEFGIAIGTLLATLVLRLEIAVLFGTLGSLVAYLYQTSRPAIRPLVPDADDPGRRFTPLDELRRPQGECPQLKLIRIEGAIYFGAVQHVSDCFQGFRAHSEQKFMLAMTKSMNFIDVAGAELWEKELATRRAMGGDIFFHRPRRPVLALWDESGFLSDDPGPHIFQTKAQALSTIVPRLDPGICSTCRVRTFTECANRPGPPADD